MRENAMPPNEQEGASVELEVDRVERDLRYLVVSMELAPGMGVTHAYLCKRLNCGRMPLREAIQRLSDTGLLVHTPNRGISIAGFDLAAYREMVAAMLVVECACMRLAAEHATEEHLKTLARIITQAEAATARADAAALSRLDYEFHRVIALASGNRYLAKSMTGLHQHASRYGGLAFRRTENAEMSWMEHRKILEAMISHDPVASEQQLREHTYSSTRRILQYMECTDL